MVKYTESQNKIVAMGHTVVSFALVLLFVATIAWSVLKALSLAAPAVLPVATGFFLALFFKPYYLWLEKKVRVPFVALLLLLVTVLFPIALLAWLAGAIIVNEIAGLVSQVSAMIGKSLDWIGSLFPNFHAALEQVKLACGGSADLVVNLVGAAPPVDASAAETACNQVAVASTSCGDAISNVVAATLNADTAKAAEIYTNGTVSAVQTTAGGMNLNTGKLGELYATYGDQIKKVGANIFQAGYDKFGPATAGGGGAVAAAATGGGSSAANVGHGNLGWTYAAGAGGVVMKVGAGAIAFFRGIVYALVTALFFVYFLMSKNLCGGRIAEVIPMLKETTRKMVANQIDTLIGILVSFYQRQTLICLIEGFFYGVGFWLVGLPYGFFVGLALGMLNLIPFFGSVVCLPLALAFAFLGAGGTGMRVVLVLLVWGVGQFLDGYYITPKIQGNKTGLGYAGVIFSFLFWTLLLGPLMGMLLAIPLSACCAVLWRTLCVQTRSAGIF